MAVGLRSANSPGEMRKRRVTAKDAKGRESRRATTDYADGTDEEKSNRACQPVWRKTHERVAGFSGMTLSTTIPATLMCVE